MALDMQAFRRCKIYDRVGTPQDILGDIEEIRQLDTQQETKEGRWQKAGCLLLPAGLLAAVFLSGTWKAVGAVLLVGGIVSFILKSKEGKLNLENRRYELAAGMLELLRADMAPDAVVDVRLNLQPVESKTKLQRTGESGRWKVKYYVDPWLQCRGRLLDGSRFQYKVLLKHQARSCWKTTPRGKRKYKTKTKTRTLSELVLTLKEGKYQSLPTLAPDMKGAVQLPARVAMTQFEVEDNRITLGSEADGNWYVGPMAHPSEQKSSGTPLVVHGVHWGASMFLSLYQGLNLVRQMDRSQGGRS